MNTLTLKGNWNIVRGKLKQRYADLTDEDLTWVEGHLDEMFGRIQKRTGQTRKAIERIIRDVEHSEVRRSDPGNRNSGVRDSDDWQRA